MSFADDTVILIHDKNIEHLYTKTNVIFNTTISWFDNNLLELNLDKTKHIVFSIQNIEIQNNFKICHHSTQCVINYNLFCKCLFIEKISCIKYLGLYIDFSFVNVSIINLISLFFFCFNLLLLYSILFIFLH